MARCSVALTKSLDRLIAHIFLGLFWWHSHSNSTTHTFPFFLFLFFFFFPPLDVPEFDLSRDTLGYSTRYLNVLLPQMPFNVNPWMRSVTPSLPFGVEIVFSSSLKLFWAFLESLFNFYSPVFSIWITFRCLCWTSSSPFIIIRYSTLWTLSLFVAYHFIFFWSPFCVD